MNTLLKRSFSSSSSSPVLSSALGSARKVVLNREKALNSLNTEMCQEVKRLLSEWNQDPDASAILMRGAGSKAFCAGGDVKSMYHAIKEKGPHIGIGHPGESSADFFREEYEMNYLLQQSSLPQVSFWDGFVMGGGVGISIFGNFRVATENTVFAMPETAIGLFPDVGSTSWLPKIPYGMGNYIALSGAKLKAADLLFAGIATHYMPSDRYEELESLMTQLPKGNRQGAREALTTALDAITAEYTSNPNSALKEEKQILESNLSSIRKCFENAKSVEDVVEALEKENADDKFIAGTLKTLRRVSPSSMKLTLEALHRAHGKDLKQCLEMEYRMVQGCMRYHDFTEGVRALLVDRDNKPAWNPSTLEGVSKDAIDAYFRPLGENELKLP